MCLQVGLVAVSVVLEAGRAQDELQHAGNVGVYILHRQLPALDRLQEGLLLIGAARHQQVVAGMDLRHGVLASKPIGHHQSFEAPLIAQDGGQQAAAFGGVFAVDSVIRRHHCPGLRLFDHRLETFQVDLSKGTGCQSGIITCAVGLLAVHGEVFHARAHALALYAGHHGCGHLACHEGIFGVILEVASAERAPVDIQGRTQNHVATIFFRLLTHCLTNLVHQSRVPSGG